MNVDMWFIRSIYSQAVRSPWRSRSGTHDGGCQFSTSPDCASEY